jgi:hypothetical protein
MIHVDSLHTAATYKDPSVDSEHQFIQDKLSAQLEKAPAASGRHVSRQTMIVAGAHLLGRTDDARTLLNVSCDCAGAMFAAVAAPAGTTVTFPFQGGELSGPSGPPGYNSGPSPWVTAVLVAVALRRADTLATLRSVPVSILEQAPGERDRCFSHLVYAFQAFFAGEDIQPPLTEFERLSQPGELKVATPAILRRFRALGPALVALRGKDQEAFTAALVAVLEAHKATFGRGQDAKSHAFLIDYHACGLAVLAREAGLTVEVESGYLPRWLVEGPAT